MYVSSISWLIVDSVRSLVEILETEELSIELIQWMNLYSKLGTVLAFVYIIREMLFVFVYALAHDFSGKEQCAIRWRHISQYYAVIGFLKISVCCWSVLSW